MLEKHPINTAQSSAAVSAVSTAAPQIPSDAGTKPEVPGLQSRRIQVLFNQSAIMYLIKKMRFVIMHVHVRQTHNACPKQVGAALMQVQKALWFFRWSFQLFWGRFLVR